MTTRTKNEMFFNTQEVKASKCKIEVGVLGNLVILKRQTLAAVIKFYLRNTFYIPLQIGPLLSKKKVQNFGLNCNLKCFESFFFFF